MLPIGNRHYCTVQGETVKAVVCERCGDKFRYQLHRTATGECVNLLWLDSKGAAETARDAAEVLLQRRLSREFDVVACPLCNHIQTEMLRSFRMQIVQFGLWMCFFLSIPSIVLFAFSLAEFSLFGAQLRIAVVGLTVPGVGVIALIFLVLLNPAFTGWLTKRLQRVSSP